MNWIVLLDGWEVDESVGSSGAIRLLSRCKTIRTANCAINALLSQHVLGVSVYFTNAALNAPPNDVPTPNRS